eukprot:3503939-Karenia_brevis.AAC.1
MFAAVIFSTGNWPTIGHYAGQRNDRHLDSARLVTCMMLALLASELLSCHVCDPVACCVVLCVFPKSRPALVVLLAAALRSAACDA